MLKVSLLAVIFLSANLFADSKVKGLLEVKQYQEIDKGILSPIKFYCSPELPTTSVSVETFDEKVVLRMLHHNGLQFAPIHSGVITLNDLPFIEKKGGLFMKMGSYITLEFELTRCKKHQEGNYSCYNSNPILIGDLSVKSFGFQTYKSTSELYGMKFETLLFRLNVTVANRNLSSTMEYNLPSDCLFR